ncbi:MAG: tRNA (adenosine(37)-N6)-dimethylallyltransferase MiaA [Alphaproteobacteria bacterium]|nr:tRNA (adenosine(37)-N6)-dimethylallyltransferase MiaA [Alphaproteobacteria bacterium]
MNHSVVVISGPTASGKSKLAMEVALKAGGVVVNCDSVQIYKGVPIISAAPSADDYAKVEHRLFEIYDCAKRGNVVDWLDLCVAEIKKIWQEGKIPVVVGGTGFYADALVNGVTPIPPVAPEVRQKINQRLHKEGLAALYDSLCRLDPAIGRKINGNDQVRIVRALEIIEFTGEKVSDWYKLPLVQKLPEARFVKVKIVPTIDEIESRCRQRLDLMVYQYGVVQEIENLVRQNLAPDLPVMKALGVPELSRFVRGECSLETALESAKLHTRQYAKRQRTWLKQKTTADFVLSEPYENQHEFLSQIIKAINENIT